MKNRKCLNCEAYTINSCSKCLAPFCSRQCQLASWRYHKNTCTSYKQIIDNFTKSIMGNINLFYSAGNTHVSIKVSEDIHTFCNTPRFCAISLFNDEHSNPSSIKIIFNDFEIEHSINKTKIKNKKGITFPDQEWTILYDPHG